MPAWGVLVYLAGDTPWGHQALQEDLAEILGTGASRDLSIVVQHDGAKGGSRWVLPHDGTPPEAAAQTFERVDSGRTAALLDFLRWGMTVCEGERLALVIGSPYSVAPGKGKAGEGNAVLSVTYDQGSGNFLDVCQLAGVLRHALSDADRSRIDLLAIDSCYVQFLELAYELEDIVRVLIAPQTPVPESGWDYREVLTEWKALAAATPPAGPYRLAERLVETVVDCYRTANPMSGASLSALDLQRLDDLANAFDTLCISTMQVLGERLIWNARELLLEQMPDTAAAAVYDCGSFFMLWGETVDAFADEAYQGWLAGTLMKAPGVRSSRFVDAVARHLSHALLSATERRAPEVRERITTLIRELREPDGVEAGQRLLRTLAAGHKQRVESLMVADPTERKRLVVIARERDAIVYDAIDKARRLLTDERQFDLQRTADAADNARRLSSQTRQAMRALLGDPRTGAPGLVLSLRSVTPSPDVWPRWSGVSMYRPNKLDDLMNDSYERFAFHQRVHWAALLGAANLIESHPRALWRLVSSLLASGGAGTRRDVLRRLTGRDSVVWGLRDQFQVMAPAPTLTLSLEQRRPAGAGTTEAGADERYLLRLESTIKGAVVTEQDSRVQPAVMDRALHELNTLLQQDSVTARGLTDLRAIGGLLGEDLFQALGRTLDDERRSVQAETPGATPHLQLQVPIELMGQPWELLHRGGMWLAEQFAMGRQVFMPTGLARRVPARRQGCVRPLIIGDPIFDAGIEYRQLPGARREAEQIAGWFERAAAEVGSIIEFDRERDTRIHTRLTATELRSLLRDGRPDADGYYYDIIHFAGHAVFRADDPETSAWLLSDGEVWALEIRNTLQDHPAPPWLVYANACESAMDGGRRVRRYQGNVFGLATAFINQGVAAYVGPLWPVDDLMAQQIALEFYRQLLAERCTLGEALRRAKVSARDLAFRTGTTGQSGLFTGLGWASLVMYGDPTEELFQALAGGGHAAHHRRAVPVTSSQAEEVGRVGRPDEAAPKPQQSVAALLHAPDFVVNQWVRGPDWVPDSGGQRGAAADGLSLELIEDAGLRRWRVRRPGSRTRGAGVSGSDGLPGSKVAAMLEDDRLRDQLPARRSPLRVIGRWVLTGFNRGVAGLVEAYDQEQVPREGLLSVSGPTSRELKPVGQPSPTAVHDGGNADRVLLLIHGTFSKSASPVDGFGPDFISWARQQYRDVIAFDHWTLSKTPEDNARRLVDDLRAFDASLLEGGRLDIIGHSRGGLVARAFCELLGFAPAVRNLVFLGTPHGGTDLANPRNWATFADLLVNMTGVDGAELFGRLAGLLARLAAANVVDGVPGLLAQNPETISVSGSFLHKLQDPARKRGPVRYSVVCSDFEPSAMLPNFKKLASLAVDAGLDTLFASANDLVVNTRHAWGIGAPALPEPPQLVADRVLLFQPPSTPAIPGVRIQAALGVHHTNLFDQPPAQEAIKAWLTNP